MTVMLNLQIRTVIIMTKKKKKTEKKNKLIIKKFMRFPRFEYMDSKSTKISTTL